MEPIFFSWNDRDPMTPETIYTLVDGVKNILDGKNGILLSEMCTSISGEAGGFEQGSFCTIIRFQGCNLACNYCDAFTTHSTTKSPSVECLSVDGIVQDIHTKNILITGGEPLVQMPGLMALLIKLNVEGHSIAIESNGTITPVFYAIKDILSKYVFPDVTWVFDYKLYIAENPTQYVRRVMMALPKTNNNNVVIKFVYNHTSELNENGDFEEDCIRAVIDTMEGVLSHPIFSWQYYSRGSSVRVNTSHVQRSNVKYVVSPVDPDAINLSENFNCYKNEILTYKDYIAKEGRMIYSLQIHKFVGVE